MYFKIKEINKQKLFMTNHHPCGSRREEASLAAVPREIHMMFTRKISVVIVTWPITSLRLFSLVTIFVLLKLL